MLNQIVSKSRPIVTVHLCRLTKKKLFHHQSAINLVPCHKTDTTQRIINNFSSSQRSHLITLLSKQFSSSTSTSNSTVASKTHENINEDKPVDEKKTIDEHSLDNLFEEMDQRIKEVNHYLQTDGKTRQLKVYGFTLITVIAGVFAGAYAAHFGAWFLDKVGLFMFEDDDDDDD